MGNWNIYIQGVGQHHNRQDKDADRMAAAFAQQLLKAGHAIEVAIFVNGAKDELIPDRQVVVVTHTTKPE